MIKRLLNGALLCTWAAGAIFSLTAFVASAQTTDGSITVQTTDATKALLAGTHLVLRDNETNVTHEGTTLKSGTYTFDALPPSTYSLTVDHPGFSSLSYDKILVQAGVATPLNIALKVGSDTQKIDVSALSVPVLETSSNTLSTSINLEEVNNLPVANRSLIALQALSPGYASATGNGTGTFNGTPQAGYQANLDGINSTSSRGKAGSGSGSAITFRVENIQEFTVQSGELPPSQGGGQSAAQTLFVTKRGTNKFHGSLFENHQDESLNAFPWSYGFQTPRLPKPHLLINDFGGSIGGPIFKDKLFFFANFSTRISPNSNTISTVLPTMSALAGNYNYFNAGGGVSTINVLQGAGAAGLDPNVNGGVLFQQNLNQGVYQDGTFTQGTTQLNTRTLNFAVPAKNTIFYPSGRLDYTVTSRLQISVSANLTRNTNNGIYQDPLPGGFQIKTTGSFSQNYVAAVGVDYTVTPTLVNQFKAGFLYTHSLNSPSASGFDVASQGNTNYNFQGIQSGNFPIVPQGNYYPYFQGNDDVSWQKGSHTIKFGGNFWHQQDHFYNPADGPTTINLGLISQDPAFNAINSLVPTSGASGNLPGNLSGAQGDVTALYGWLDGRVTSASYGLPVNPATGTYTTPGSYFLDEKSLGGGLYVQDSWRAQPGLTLNYGLRWDFISDIHDAHLGYTGPSAADLFGSSGYMNIFQPGADSGSPNPLYTTSQHKYNSSLVLPQPQIGFAWNPSGDESFLGKLFGAGKTVIRGSYTLKNYTEGGQSFWQAASNSGYNFFNNNSLTASNTVGPQYYTPGSIKLVTPPSSCTGYIANCVNTATIPTMGPFFASPATYQTTIPQSSLFFKGSGAPAAIDPNIKQPYVESYTLGIQRQIGHSSAFEIRYVGNRSIHDWIAINYNEINSLNNGFYQDFTAAQRNLAINAAAGHPNDFSNRGGGPAMPILSAAFAGASAGGFTNGSYVTLLKNGSLGGLAAAIANNETYFCNVVSQAFAPCKAVASSPVGSNFPSNLFQVNPYLEGSGASLTSSKGSSNYNSLQMEFRQKVSHGLDLNVNYTYGKTLGFSSNEAAGSIGNAASVITLHNLHYNYQPISYDTRHALKASGTYALPFGKNKAFLSQGKLTNYVVGGWTAGMIFIYQSGAPFALTGGLSSTINSASDGGVTFVGGTSAHDIQKSVGITRSKPGNTYVNFIGSKFQGTSTANPNYVVPNTTPGTEGNLPFIYGPKWNNFDLAATKDLPIFRAVHINLQGIFLNAFNHPEWITSTASTVLSTQSSTFGTTSTTAQAARRIELRANVTF